MVGSRVARQSHLAERVLGRLADKAEEQSRAHVDAARAISRCPIARLYSHEQPISAAAARRREYFFALFSLPTIEIEGGRPADFPTTFRNQGGRRPDPDFYRNASYCISLDRSPDHRIFRLSRPGGDFLTVCKP